LLVGVSAMDSTVTARKALAAAGLPSCVASADCAAKASTSAGSTTSKVSRTLAASTVSVTAAIGTPTSSATACRIPIWTLGVKSETSPAAMTAVVSVDTVGGSGTDGETCGGADGGSGGDS
jgi:hypothetical protein